MKFRTLFLIIFILNSSASFAQQDLYKWRVKAFAGTAQYYSKPFQLKNTIIGNESVLYRIAVNRRLNKTFAIGVNATFGNINDKTGLLNSYSEVSASGLQLYFYSDNGWLLPSNAFIAPFIYAGVTANSFRDYRSGNFVAPRRNQTTVPIGGGLKFRVSERINFNIEAEAIFPTEQVKNSSSFADLQPAGINWLQGGIALAYNFGFINHRFNASRFYASNAMMEKSVLPMQKMSPMSLQRSNYSSSDNSTIDSIDYAAIFQTDSLNSSSQLFIEPNSEYRILANDSFPTYRVMPDYTNEQQAFDPNLRSGNVDVNYNAGVGGSNNFSGINSKLNQLLLQNAAILSSLNAFSGNNRTINPVGISDSNLINNRVSDDVYNVQYDILRAQLAAMPQTIAQLEQSQEAKIEGLQQQINNLQALMEQNAGLPPASVVTAPSTLTTIYFKNNSTIIPYEAWKDLSFVLSRLKEIPNVRVSLSGFCDRSGNPKLNMQLSHKRVETIAHFLQKRGIQNDRIIKEYFGDTQAELNDDILERKVEIQILK